MSTTSLAELSHRHRRALLKKLKRKQARQLAAKHRDALEAEELARQENSPTFQAAKETELQRQAQEALNAAEQERLWLEREKEAQLQWQETKKRAELARIRELEAQALIRLEWEKSWARAASKDEAISAKTSADSSAPAPAAVLVAVPGESNSPAWHLPPPPAEIKSSSELAVAMTTRRPDQVCSFFRKTGACRYGWKCSRHHDYPSRDGSLALPTEVRGEDETAVDSVADIDACYALCIPNMFIHVYLPGASNELEEQEPLGEAEESQLQTDFADFYWDVRSELESRWGRIANFRVCRNRVDHLRGSVYVEFHHGGLQAAWDAAEICNGRWFAGRALSCHVVRLGGGWREAICGLYHRGRCPKGDLKCNFLHVFHNPGEVDRVDPSSRTWQSKERVSTRDRMSESRHPSVSYRRRTHDSYAQYPRWKRYRGRDERRPGSHWRARSPYRSQEYRRRSPLRSQRRRSPSRRSSRRRSSGSSTCSNSPPRRWSRSPLRAGRDRRRCPGDPGVVCGTSPGSGIFRKRSPTGSDRSPMSSPHSSRSDSPTEPSSQSVTCGSEKKSRKGKKSSKMEKKKHHKLRQRSCSDRDSQ